MMATINIKNNACSTLWLTLGKNILLQIPIAPGCRTASKFNNFYLIVIIWTSLTFDALPTGTINNQLAIVQQTNNVKLISSIILYIYQCHHFSMRIITLMTCKLYYQATVDSIPQAIFKIYCDLEAIRCSSDRFNTTQ